MKNKIYEGQKLNNFKELINLYKTKYKKLTAFEYKESPNAKKHIKITANNRDLPYIIAYKKRYLRHSLWNGLLLTTNNQLNFYELIKVYAQDRVVELSTKRLRQLLGVENYYSTKDVMRYIRSYNNVLKEKTDIHCILQKGRIAERNRILSMRFFIYDNISFKPNKYLESLIHLWQKKEIQICKTS